MLPQLPIPVQPGRNPVGVGDRRQRADLGRDRRARRWRIDRFVSGVGMLRNDDVDDAVAQQVSRPNTLCGSQFRGMVGVAEDDRACPSGGSGASQPCCAASTRSAGTIASAGPPLPCPSSTETVGVSRVTRSARHRAISPASPPCSASADSAGPAVSITRPAAASARRPAPCRGGPPQCAGPTSPPTTRCWPSTTAGWPPNRASASSVVRPHPARCRTTAATRLRRAAAVARHRVGPAVARRSPTPTRHVRQRFGLRVGRRGRDRRRPLSAPSPASAQPGERHHTVDDAVLLQVLGGLHADRERLAVQLFVDPRTEETDQRARLRDRDVAERTPRCEHPAGGRMPQIHQIGQVRASCAA